MNGEEAKRLFDDIRAAIRSAAALRDLILDAYVGQAWKGAGYETWDACCAAEFGDVIAELEKDRQRDLILSLDKAGMSTRAIGAAVGKSHQTVGRELASGPSPQENGPVGTHGDDLKPQVTTGIDGKERIRPKPRAPEPTFDDDPPLFGQPAPQPPRPAPVMLTLRTHDGREVPYPQPRSAATFNQTDGDGISWAKWSWNPVTGCLHGCDYCYARAIAARWTDAYPAGFTPLFHHERLDAPANTVIPAAHRGDPAWRRVFVCSMADLYGRWVPDEWIKQVHESMLASPQWQYILLTKFPDGYPGLDIPPGAWVGTSVDEQKRVRIAERAFREIDGAAVRWLSLEPLREPLEFTDLSMFDWVVIGAQTKTVQPDGIVVPEFEPHPDWVIRITHQAREAGCAVHWKPNLRTGLWFDQYPVRH